MKQKILIGLLLWGVSMTCFSQQGTFTVRGSVKEESTFKPVKGAEIRIAGKNNVLTDGVGDFRIPAMIGDELIVSHHSFTTVRYTIKDRQRIDIVVKENARESRQAELGRLNENKSIYSSNLNAAKTNLKKDAAISIDYVTKAFETVRDDDQLGDQKKAVLYETLADIYSYWKQPDLAEDNYKNSINSKFSNDVQIKLGYAQLENKNYEEAQNTFSRLEKSRLSSLQKVEIYKGLGDVYSKQNDDVNAVKKYNEALVLAEKNKYENIVIELNNKLAETLQEQGNIDDAEEYLGNSVELASSKSKKVSARQRAKAADFYNKRSSYKKEIQLRKEALEDIEGIEEKPQLVPKIADSILSGLNSTEDRAITTQVQNYKIANAFAAQSEYDEAIPYLEESIKQAASENDLVVQKDATRKLGEVYREKGELKKASEAFEKYEVIIDKLYIQKEQEISQITRFNRELAEKAQRITTLEKDRELNESRYKLAFASQESAEQQKVIIYSLIGLSVLLLFAAYLMYRNIKQQRYANNLLALKSLRSQMNPHFIFNALNSVNTFIATNDERTANRYLTDFSLLMRAVLENSEENFIPLEKEIELLQLYVQLEHFRFQDKFEYHIEVSPEIDIKEYMIPPMLLQPYVENAVWHGLRYREDKGVLSIKFVKTKNDVVEIIISDNGIGREKSKALKTMNQKKQKSQGMSNIKKRIGILNTMYKDKVDVFISDPIDEEGTVVKLVLKNDK